MATDKVVHESVQAPARLALLDKVARVLPLVADLARADALLCERRGEAAAFVRFHARPHSIAPVHKTIITEHSLYRLDAAPLFAVFEGERYARGTQGHGLSDAGAPIMQEAFAVYEGREIIAVVLFETNLLEHERMKRRSVVIQRAIRQLKWMTTRGEPEGAEELTAFGEYDGIVIADADRVIRYMSGVGLNLYRNVGLSEDLIGRPLADTEMAEDTLAQTAINTSRCREAELEERGHVWIKKAIPLREIEEHVWQRGRQKPTGVLLMVRDDTEARRQETELKIKTTMIKEVHHRVKNDLQTLAALLRMQSRRVQTDEAKGVLSEAVSRILSIAVIHEFLSEQDSRIINIREVASRILNQLQSALLDPTRSIEMSLTGPNIYLPARQATSCALVVNELLQNALEHGFDARKPGGTITVTMQDEGDMVEIHVHDDGHGLPKDFDLERVDSLGLRIVRMLVYDDLKGSFEMKSNGGVSARVRFPKISLGGENTWNERDSS